MRTHPASAVRGSRVAAGLQRAPGWVRPVEVRGDVHRRRGPHGALRVDSIAERHRVAVGGRSGAFAVLVARDGEAHRALDGLGPSGRASDVHRVSSSAPDWSGAPSLSRTSQGFVSIPRKTADKESPTPPTPTHYSYVTDERPRRLSADPARARPGGRPRPARQDSRSRLHGTPLTRAIDTKPTHLAMNVSNLRRPSLTRPVLVRSQSAGHPRAEDGG